MAKQTNNIQIFNQLPLTWYAIERHICTGDRSDKGIHFAKAPVTFNTSVSAGIFLSDTFFLHQQDLALLIIVCTFLPVPSFVTLHPSLRFRTQFLNFYPALFDDFPPLFPCPSITLFIGSVSFLHFLLFL